MCLVLESWERREKGRKERKERKQGEKERKSLNSSCFHHHRYIPSCSLSIKLNYDMCVCMIAIEMEGVRRKEEKGEGFYMGDPTHACLCVLVC